MAVCYVVLLPSCCSFHFRLTPACFAQRTGLCGFWRVWPARRLMLDFLVRIRGEGLEIPRFPSSVSLGWTGSAAGKKIRYSQSWNMLTCYDLRPVILCLFVCANRWGPDLSVHLRCLIRVLTLCKSLNEPCGVRYRVKTLIFLHGWADWSGYLWYTYGSRTLVKRRISYSNFLKK